MFIRKTILSDIKLANTHTKNHKLNRVVQAMLFGMVERGLGLDFVGDKGKARVISDSTSGPTGQDAMWAVVLTKELWQKSIWSVLFAPLPFYPNFLEGMMQNLSQS